MARYRVISSGLEYKQRTDCRDKRFIPYVNRQDALNLAAVLNETTKPGYENNFNWHNTRKIEDNWYILVDFGEEPEYVEGKPEWGPICL